MYGNLLLEKKLLLEESLVETCEASCMASLVLSHLMNGVVDSVRALLLSQLSDAELVLASTLLGSDASLEIALSVAQYLAQELSETASVVSLLVSIALVSLCYLRIALTVGLTSHSEIHTNLDQHSPLK